MVSGGGTPNLMLAQVQVLGPFGPDVGPDLDLTWDLDLSLTIIVKAHTWWCSDDNQHCVNIRLSVEIILL